VKVVVDSNVVVSAILKDRVPEQVLQFILQHSEMEWIATDEIVNEYLAVLARPKFAIPQPILEGCKASSSPELLWLHRARPLHCRALLAMRSSWLVRSLAARIF
jgi:predicted nucleic acid-binding protein